MHHPKFVALLFIFICFFLQGCVSAVQWNPTLLRNDGGFAVFDAMEVVERSIKNQQNESLKASKVSVSPTELRSNSYSRLGGCLEYKNIDSIVINKKGRSYRVTLNDVNGRRIYVLSDRREQFALNFANAIATLKESAKGLASGEGCPTEVLILKEYGEIPEQCLLLRQEQCGTGSYRGDSSCRRWFTSRALQGGANVVNMKNEFSKFRLFTPTHRSTYIDGDYYYCGNNVYNALKMNP